MYLQASPATHNPLIIFKFALNPHLSYSMIIDNWDSSICYGNGNQNIDLYT